jgi:predicted N-formylglutamate amidohydrolase
VTLHADSDVLALEDGPAAWTENAAGPSPVLLVCDHASNRIPRSLGDLDLSADVLQSHAAWDPGAYEVALRLAKILDAALVSTNFSRLVYDVNRPPDSPQAIRAASEIYDIPGNRDLSPEQRKARADALYHPFHDTIDAMIEARADQGRSTVLVTVHSFTPVFHGKERGVELGILHDADVRFADRLLDAAKRLTKLRTERNQPYGPADGVTHTLVRHALPRGLLNGMIEIRNDLIRTEAQQSAMAEMLSRLMRSALDNVDLPSGESLTRTE